jgi:diguanylate cyclase (GGDEF)-like protein/PAS domain S-box-containing protein
MSPPLNKEHHSAQLVNGDQAVTRDELVAALNALPHSFFMVDSNDRYIFQNAYDQSAYGNLIGRKPAELHAQMVSAATWRDAHATVLSGTPVDYVYNRLGDTGDSTTEVFLRPLRAPDQSVIGAVGVSIDQTKLFTARKQLLLERSRIQAFLECSSDWVWEQDEQLRFTSGALPGRLDLHSTIGLTRWAFAGVDVDADPIWRAHIDQLKRREPIRNFVYKTRSKSGLHVWIEVNGQATFDADGAFTGYRGTARDVTDREHRYEELRRAQLVLDTTQSAVIICDQQRRITWVNPAFEKLSGYALPELLGKSPGEVLQCSETDPATIAKVREALDRGEGVHVDILNRAKNGQTYWVEMDIRPVPSAAGEPKGYIAVETDISEKVALRRRLMTIFDNVPACIAVFNEDGVIEDCNREVLRLTQLSKENVVGLSCRSYTWHVYDEAGPPYATQEHPVFKAFAENRPVEDALIGWIPDGKTEMRWLRGNVNPVIVDGGSRIAIFSFSDITGEIATRSNLRKALKETKRAFAELSAYKAALDKHSTVTVVDAQRRLTYVNDAFCHASGFSRAEALGQTLGSLVDSGCHTQDFYDAMWRAISNGQSWRWRVCNRNKSGILYWLDETVVPQTNEQGDIVAYISIGFDVTRHVLAEERTRQSEIQYRLLADNSSDVIILGHNNGTRTYFSPAVTKLTGYTQAEALRVPMRDWVHPDDIELLFAATSKLTAENATTTVVHRLRRKDGTYIWVEGAFTRVMADYGDSPIVATIRDVTRRRALENDYKNLFDHGIVGIYRKSLDGRLLRANPALVAMRGFTNEADLIRADHAGEAGWHLDPTKREQRQAQLMRDGTVKDFVSQVIGRDGSHAIWISETAWLVKDDEGMPLYIEGMVADVTERLTSQSILEHQARHDTLTSLPNRFAFRAAADALIAREDLASANVTILYIDLDRFKGVNDTLGHAAGDELLKTVAHRLERAVGSRGLLARLGGDEFAIMLRHEPAINAGEQVAIESIAAINHPIALTCGQTVNVGASVGIASVALGEANAEQVIRRADLAMYQAKRDGRNAFRRYTKALDEQATLRQTVEVGLRRAIVRDEFELHFQPLFHLSTLEQTGFEALLRWRHPDTGLMSPATFVPIAEETGLIVPIGGWVIREALRHAATWPNSFRIAINVSVVQLRHPGFVETLRDAMQAARVSPERIEVEVTESALLDDSLSTKHVLHQLHKLGVNIALDDFGTGWSSLSYLNRHHFNRIKIDRSFVQGMSDPRNEAIIEAIIGLGTRLGIVITAEGVETGDQVETLTELGCHEVQGFLLGRPMPGDEALRFSTAIRNVA